MTSMRRPRRIALPWLAAAVALCACGASPPPDADAPARDAATAADAVDAPDEPMPSPEHDPVPSPEVAAATPEPAPIPPASARPPATPRPVVAPRPLPPSAGDAGEAEAQPPTLVVTMLSRGKGVPDATRAAYQDIQTLLSTDYPTAELRAQRIGLEGETRLCAEFRSARDAQAALAGIRNRTTDVELIDVAAGPCPLSKEAKP